MARRFGGLAQGWAALFVAVTVVVAGSPAARADDGSEPTDPDELPLVPLTEAPPEGYERIEAYAPGEAHPAEAAAAPAQTKGAGPRFAVALRGGAYVPFGALPVGPTAGLAVSMDLGRTLGLEVGAGRLEARLDLGWARTTTTRPSLVPGRGYDAGFTQDSHLVPASLALAWRFSPGAVHPYALAGIGTEWTSSRFTAFSRPEERRAFAPMGLVGGGAALSAGPGALGLEAILRFAGFDLGPLGAVGEPVVTGLELAATYRIRF